jgi:hypothetical protein
MHVKSDLIRTGTNKTNGATWKCWPSGIRVLHSACGLDPGVTDVQVIFSGLANASPDQGPVAFVLTSDHINETSEKHSRELKRKWENSFLAIKPASIASNLSRHYTLESTVDGVSTFTRNAPPVFE